jgi:tetratricopeptide (TPR) repeat protein
MKSLAVISFCVFFTGASLSQQANDQNVFRLAQAFEQQGDLERALELYRDLYVRDPTNFPYFDAVRRTYVQLKKYDEAIAVSRRRLRSLPFDISLQANIGSLYSMSGREAQADSAWDQILSAAGKNQLYFRTVAAEQTNQRLFDKAIGTYQRGRREIGDPYIFANELGYLYGFMMDYENAAKEYLLMLRQNEQQFDYIQSRLAAFVNKNDGLRAVSAVVASETMRRQTVPLLRLQMWLFLEEKKYADAFDVAQTIEKLLNSGGVEIFQFAERLSREKEFAVASRAYLLALSKNLPVQNIPSAKFGYARCVEELSLRGDTIAPRNAPASSTISEIQQGFSAAIVLYGALAREYPFTGIAANALYRIGMIRYTQMADLDGALHVFDSVLTVSPAGSMISTVLSTIGEIYIMQNKLDEADKKFLVMSTTTHSTPEQKDIALFRRAEIQFFKHRFDSALTLLQPLTQNLKADETNDALLLRFFITENMLQFTDALKSYARAELLTRRNRLSEAAAELTALVDLYPNAPLADDAMMAVASNLTRLQRYRDALIVYNTLFEEYPVSSEKEKAYFRIGELYQYHLDDRMKAIEAYTVILEKYPFSLFSDEARKRIRLLRGDPI